MKTFKPETSFAKILFYGDPGSGKCVVGGTQIQLADGRRLPIEQITQPTILLTWTGQAFTPAVCNSVEAFGNKLCCKLTTFTGRELEASVDHPVLTTEGWKVMKDITPGDYLILPWCIDYDFGGNLTSAEAKLLEDIFYDRVVDVSETGTKPVFNVEVPKYHTLVTNGIVTHNTTLLGTVMDDERTSPCLWLDCGGNPESIRLNTSLPTILQIEKPEDLNGPYEWLRKGQPDNHPFVTMCEKLGTHLTPPYKSVVSVDCLTELQRQYIKQFSGNTDKQPGDALAPVEIREWGTTLMAMINMMSMYKNLPMHVFATCHEDDKKNRDGAVISTGVWLWGQGRIEVPAYMLAQIRLVRTNELPATMQKKATELEPEAMNIAYFDKLGPFDVKQQYVKKRLGWMPAPTITKVLDVLEIH